MMDTLLLDTALWDLVVDASGNLAVATDPYSVAQDVASACRLFQGDYWYDTTFGIPYFADVLGRFPPASLVKTLLANAAAAIPGCNNPTVVLSGVGTDRRLTGQVQFTDSNGAAQVVAF